MAEARKGKAKVDAEYAPKDRVEHARFGPGTVLEIDERYVTIAFDESDRDRKFVLSIVQLKPSDVPAPTRSRAKRKTAKKTATKKTATKAAKKVTKKTAKKTAAKKTAKKTVKKKAKK